MNELELIGKVEVIEKQAKECLDVATTTTARLSHVANQLEQLVDWFWKTKETETKTMLAETEKRLSQQQ